MTVEQEYQAFVSGAWAGAAALRARCADLTALQELDLGAQVLPLLMDAAQDSVVEALRLWRGEEHPRVNRVIRIAVAAWTNKVEDFKQAVLAHLFQPASSGTAASASAPAAPVRPATGAVAAVMPADKWGHDANTLTLLHSLAQSGTVGADVAVPYLFNHGGGPAHSLRAAQGGAAPGAATWTATTGVPPDPALRPVGPLPRPPAAAAIDAPGVTPSAATANAVGADLAEATTSALSWLPPHVLLVMRNPEVGDQRKLQLCRFYAEQLAGSLSGHDGRFVILHGDGDIVPQTFDSEERAASAANSGGFANALLMRLGGALEREARI
jgi:hypothetical protein